MTLIRSWLIPGSPGFEALAGGTEFRDRIVALVTAPADAICDAIHHVSLADMNLTWRLGESQSLPTRLTGDLQPDDCHRSFLKVLRRGGTQILNDAPCEVLLGSAGQLHRIVDQAPLRFADARAFVAFQDPDYEKLFTSLRLEPSSDPRSHWLVLDHATLALSEDTRAKFSHYWPVIKPAGALVSRGLLSAIRRRAEATPAYKAA